MTDAGKTPEKNTRDLLHRGSLPVGQRQLIDRLEYLKQLEACILPPEMSERIDVTRLGVSELLNDGSWSEMDPDLVERLKEITVRELESGEKSLTTEEVMSFERGHIVPLIRHQIRVLAAIKSFDINDREEKQRMLNEAIKADDVYHLIDKKLKNGERRSDPETNYYLGHLLSELTSALKDPTSFPKVAKEMESFYKALEEDLESGSDRYLMLKEIREKSFGQLSNQLQKRIFDVLKSHGVSIQIPEIMDLLDSNDVIIGNETAGQRMAQIMSDIEESRFDLEVLQWRTDVTDSMRSHQEARIREMIKSSESEILHVLGQFRQFISSPERQIGLLFSQSKISQLDRDRLRDLQMLLKPGSEEIKRFRDQILKVNSTTDVQQIISDFQEPLIERIMKEQEVSKDQVETYLLSHPTANIFQFRRNQLEYADYPATTESPEMKAKPQLSPEKLSSVRSELKRMQYFHDVMRTENRPLGKEEKALYQDSIFKVWDYCGISKEQLQSLGKNWYEKPDTLEMLEKADLIPPFEKAQFEWLKSHHPDLMDANLQVMRNKFSRSMELFESGMNSSNSREMKKFLMTFLSEYDRATETQKESANAGVSSSYYSKLSGLMSLDHPLTAMRYKTDGNLFVFDGTPLFNQHQVIGKKEGPATFLERSKDLMERVLEAFKSGNPLKIGEVMRMAGDPLISDVEFFPMASIKNPEQTQEQLSFIKSKRHNFPYQVPDYKPGQTLDMDLSLQGFFDEHTDLKYLDDSLVRDPSYESLFKGLEERMEEEMALGRDELEQSLFLPEESITAGAGASDEGLSPYQRALAVGLKDEKDGELKQSIMKWGKVAGTSITKTPRALKSMYESFKYGTFGWMRTYGRNYSKNTVRIPPLALYKMIESAYESITKRTDVWVEFSANNLGSNLFGGTFIGVEFTRSAQDNQSQRVSFYKDTYKDYGHYQVYERLLDPADAFELKAAIENLMQDRGFCNIDALLEPKVIRSINKYSTKPNIPIPNSREEVMQNEEMKDWYFSKLQDSIDQMWGDGTFQSYRNAASGAFDSQRNKYKESARTWTAAEKHAKLESYWEALGKGDVEEMRKIHPAEIFGLLDWEIGEGGHDVGHTFGLMQACIIEGIFPDYMVKKIQNEHANDWPSFTLMEPLEAELCGLADHYRANKGKPYDIENPKSNPYLAFYDGITTLPLKGKFSGGKWKFPKTLKELKGMEDDLKVSHMTVRALQGRREAQVANHRTMDNSMIHIFSSSYQWAQVQQAFNPNESGGFSDVRPHDMCAAYRGVNDDFIANMELLKSIDKDATSHAQLEFDRACLNAYKALSFVNGYATYFSRSKNRTTDFQLNEDGSINYQVKYNENGTDERNKGETNLQRLILSQGGGAQRLGQSAGMMDNSDAFSPELRKAFKRMAGYQHIKVLGVDPETGKSNGRGFTTFSHEAFKPHLLFEEAVQAFLKRVQELAAEKGLKANFLDSGIRNIKDPERLAKMYEWTRNVAQL